MRMQPLTYLIAGLLMMVQGASFALMFAYGFDHSGRGLAIPYRLLIVTVPLGLGLLFVRRSGSLRTARTVEVASVPVQFVAERQVEPGPDAPRRFLMVGLLFTIVAAMSALRGVPAGEASERDVQTAGFAIVSILALVTAMPRFARGARHFLWCLVCADLLMIFVSVVDLSKR